MRLLKPRWIVSILIPVLLASAVAFANDYIPSNRDTKKAPEPMTFESTEPKEFTLLYETETFKFYFKEERDVIAIYDKRNGYTWKTGLDIPYDKEIDDANEEAIEAGLEPEYFPKEDRLNTTYTGMANSLVTIEYYDEANNIKRNSSAAYKNAKSELKQFSDNHYRLDMKFTDVKVQLKLHIYFDEKGVRYEIKDEEIEGEGTNVLAAVIVSPFLGASGGQKLLWNPEEQDYKDPVPNEMIPGYVFVPDGSGALIRFQDNNTTLKEYIGDVYGTDYSQSQYYYDYDQGYIPFKSPTFPVFGIAHGDQQNAFSSFALEGAEHMEIVVVPEDNMTFYTWAYPRFVYNNLYYQIYNKKGDGYFSLFEERNHFNVNLRYDFLQGDGSEGELPADYIGMALTYREYLIENKLLTIEDEAQEDIPIRLDFIQSDIKKSILGFEDVVVTTADEVGSILKELSASGITNINSGLYGWQKGGITLGKPWQANWGKSIGSEGDFKTLIADTKELGIDVSLAQDYVMINEEQMNFKSNAAKHINGWYNEYYLSRFSSKPIYEFSYAKPTKSMEWLVDQEDELEDLKATSVSIGRLPLLSDHGRQVTSVEDTIKLYQDTFGQVKATKKINATSPNAYLWPYVDRYLNAPVFSTQFIMETDTVPFLQLVLKGTMELYASYSNFSFYTEKDILRMIDYNVYPSFVLTQESSHHLAVTNASDFYSTEYSLYKASINNVYGKVNEALGHVRNSQWINREVLEEGVILNSYDNGVQLLINYTDQIFTYKETQIQPLSCQKIE